MNRFTTGLCLLLLGLTFTSASAKEFAGIYLPDSYSLDGQELALNGAGLRKKFFLKIYAGALYTSSPTTSTDTVLRPELAKVIRMHFLYSKVSGEKIRESFAEGMEKNYPGSSSTAPAQAFLQLFSFDLKETDTLDLLFHSSGSLSVRHNGRDLGTFPQAELNRTVLSIYLGREPIESLKQGMLGG